MAKAAAAMAAKLKKCISLTPARKSIVPTVPIIITAAPKSGSISNNTAIARVTKTGFKKLNQSRDIDSLCLTRYPDKKVIQTAHTAELAVGFGRKVRNLVGDKDYQNVFGEVKLQADSKAAGRWNTNHKGEYFAIGVGGAVTGKGADLLIIDDPHSEQEGASSDVQADEYSIKIKRLGR